MSELQDIDTLRMRFEKLRDKKTSAEALLKNAEDELRRLMAEAKERYGTSDVESLKAKLAQIEKDNRDKQRQYQDGLDAIEAKLKEVEAEFTSEGGEAGG